MFSHFFIQRPIFAVVISIVTVVGGLVALFALPVSRYPDLAPPTVQVSTVYPGADARTVSETVATPLEQEVNGVENMIYMTSVSANDGTMTLTVTFAPGTDLDIANVLTQNRVSKAEARLPEEVKRQGVTVAKKSTDVVMYVAFTSPDGTYDDQYLSNFVWQRVRDELARVNGVGDVAIYGVGQFSMRIWLDPEKLRSFGLAATDVIGAIREQNVQVAGGKIGGEPAPENTAYEFTVNVRGRLSEPSEFENIVVKIAADGSLLRVKDVARVELGSDLYSFSANYNGKAAAALAVYQIPGSNIMDVADGIRSTLDELAKSFPKGIEYVVTYDNTDIIVASIKSVIITLLQALVLVVLTVYIFLQNLRATIIPAVTIPVALIGTFGVLLALGFSLNQLTLFGLVLVIGIVVDDAIVVVENTTRWIDEGLTPKEAAKKAMTEVSGPVVATTLVLLAVFVPTIFMGGITGTLFTQFAVTISVATVFSSINALTLSPALASIILRKQKGERKGLFKIFNVTLDKTTNGYLGITRLAIRRAIIAVLLFGGLAYAAIFGLGSLNTGFVPQEDEGYCMVSAQLPDGSSLQRTKRTLGQIDDIVKSIPEVEGYLTIAGYSLIDGSAATNAGFVVVTFKHWDERSGAESHQSEIIKKINQRLAAIQDARAFSFAMPSLPGVGTSGGFTYMLQDRDGIGFKALQETAQDVIDDGNAQSGLAGLNTPFRASTPQLFVDIDREQVMRTGTSIKSVFDTLQTYLGSAYVNDFTYLGRIFKVTAQADGKFRSQPEAIRDLELRGGKGEMIPLGALASVEESYGPQSITRFNLYPSAKILGGAAPGYSSGQAIEIMEDMSKDKNLQFEWSELSYQEKKAAEGGGTSMIFLFAILMVYLVLAAQYESWTIPISVVLSVPTALLGAVIAIMARGMDNNVYTQIGIVLLIGLSTKSAILIVEFAKVQREEGRSVADAALDATRLRFRAVLMTAFSFILGVIPLLIATGAGAESQKVIGTSVFGGMIVATLVSLAAVPMLYYVVQRTADKSWGKGDTSFDPATVADPDKPT